MYGIALSETISFMKSNIKNSTDFYPMFQLHEMKQKFDEIFTQIINESIGSRYSRMGQVKLVENSL